MKRDEVDRVVGTLDAIFYELQGIKDALDRISPPPPPAPPELDPRVFVTSRKW